MYPSDRLYTTEHEWVKTEGDICVIGITKFAQQELGDVVHVDLPMPGSTCTAGDPIGTIESVKAVAELYAPVAGEVVAINEDVMGNPDLLNGDPHGAGWLVKVSSGAALDGLMNAERYEAYLQSGDA